MSSIVIQAHQPTNTTGTCAHDKQLHLTYWHIHPTPHPTCCIHPTPNPTYCTHPTPHPSYCIHPTPHPTYCIPNTTPYLLYTPNTTPLNPKPQHLYTLTHLQHGLIVWLYPDVIHSTKLCLVLQGCHAAMPHTRNLHMSSIVTQAHQPTNTTGTCAHDKQLHLTYWHIHPTPHHTYYIHPTPHPEP